MRIETSGWRAAWYRRTFEPDDEPPNRLDSDARACVLAKVRKEDVSAEIVGFFGDA